MAAPLRCPRGGEPAPKPQGQGDVAAPATPQAPDPRRAALDRLAGALDVLDGQRLRARAIEDDAAKVAAAWEKLSELVLAELPPLKR